MLCQASAPYCTLDYCKQAAIDGDYTYMSYGEAPYWCLLCNGDIGSPPNDDNGNYNLYTYQESCRGTDNETQIFSFSKYGIRVQIYVDNEKSYQKSLFIAASENFGC